MPLFLARFSHGPKTSHQEVESYFKHLEAEHETLIPDIREEEERRIQEILTRGRTDPGKLTWDDLLDLEILLLHVMPENKLERKAWMIRERYRKAVGEKHYAEYLHSKPPRDVFADHQIDDVEGRRLRADLEVLLQDLFWRYRLKTIWEDARISLFSRFGLALALIAAAGAAAIWALYWFFDSVQPWKAALTVVAVALAGIAGSFISLLKRLDDVPSSQRRTVNLIQMEHGSTALVIQSVLTGGIFALLLLLMFSSGLLKGELFPELTGVTVLGWLAGAFATPVLFAKVVLWSFVAGFAERLVPDLLDTLGQRQSLAEPATNRKGRTTPATNVG